MVARGRHPLQSLLTGLCSRRSSSTVLRSSGWRLTNLKICELLITRPLVYSTTLFRSCSQTYGRVYPYDKTYDRINARNEKPLQLLDRIKYNPTTSDDPVIQSVSVNSALR